MDARLTVFLQRIGQADSMLRDRGRDPEPFHLLHAGGMSREVSHPAWNESWPVPTSEDIDDLEELGFLRVEPSANMNRKFSLTVKGREQAALLAQPQQTYVGGRAPPIDEVLDWLVELEPDSPDAFEPPTGLIDEAVERGLIEETGREALADTLVRLHGEGFLKGDLPQLEEASAEDRLGLSAALRPTIKARDRAREQSGSQGPSIEFYGPVVASQIASGDINNFVSFTVLLDRAADELKALEEVDDGTRAEAHGLLDALRGKAGAAGGQVFTGAGGALLASVLGRLLGLPV